MTAGTQPGGKRILVAEDDYFIAKGIVRDLERLGHAVVGPFPSLADALDAVAAGTIDGALLDVNLRGEASFPVADALMARGVPMVLTTGYGADAIPPRYRAIPRCEKPVQAGHALEALFGRAG